MVQYVQDCVKRSTQLRWIDTAWSDGLQVAIPYHKIAVKLTCLLEKNSKHFRENNITFRLYMVVRPTEKITRLKQQNICKSQLMGDIVEV